MYNPRIERLNELIASTIHSSGKLDSSLATRTGVDLLNDCRYIAEDCRVEQCAENEHNYTEDLF